MPLILASSSPIRRAMLEAAGVSHEVVPPGVNEDAIKERLTDPQAIVAELAAAKAMAVGAVSPGNWVIGSDSVVSVDGCVFDKPADRDEAAEHLRCFSGKVMGLTSAVVLARGITVDWSFVGRAQLHVRNLSSQFIEDYLEAEWPEVAYCVGVFRLEGSGVQLFERIEGDHFTILGMPLLPLLGALRERGLIAS